MPIRTRTDGPGTGVSPEISETPVSPATRPPLTAPIEPTRVAVVDGGDSVDRVVGHGETTTTASLALDAPVTDTSDNTVEATPAVEAFIDYPSTLSREAAQLIESLHQLPPHLSARSSRDTLAALSALASTPDQFAAMVFAYEAQTGNSFGDVLARLRPARDAAPIREAYLAASARIAPPSELDDTLDCAAEIRTDDAAVAAFVRERLDPEQATRYAAALELAHTFAARTPPLLVDEAEIARFMLDGALDPTRSPNLCALHERITALGDRRAARVFSSLFRLTADFHEARASELRAALGEARAAFDAAAPEARSEAARQLFALQRALHTHESLGPAQLRAARSVVGDARDARIARASRRISQLSTALTRATTDEERTRISGRLALARTALRNEADALVRLGELTATRRDIAVDALPRSLVHDITGALDAVTRADALAIAASCTTREEALDDAGAPTAERVSARVLPAADSADGSSIAAAERFDPHLAASASLESLPPVLLREARTRREAHLSAVTDFSRARHREATVRLTESGLYLSESERRASPSLPRSRDGVTPTDAEIALVREARAANATALAALGTRIADATEAAESPRDAATIAFIDSLRRSRGDVLTSIHEERSEDAHTRDDLREVRAELAYADALREVASTSGVAIVDANGRPYGSRMAEHCRAALPRLLELQAELNEVRSRDSAEAYLAREPYARALETLIQAGEAVAEHQQLTTELTTAAGAWSDLDAVARASDVRADAARREEEVAEAMSALSGVFDDTRRVDEMRSRERLLAERVALDPDMGIDAEEGATEATETRRLSDLVGFIHANELARVADASGDLPVAPRERFAALRARSLVLEDVALRETTSIASRAYVIERDARERRDAARLDTAATYRVGDGYYIRTRTERADAEATGSAATSTEGIGIDRDTRDRTMATHDTAFADFVQDAVSLERRDAARGVVEVLEAGATARTLMGELRGAVPSAEVDQAILASLVEDVTVRHAAVATISRDTPELSVDILRESRTEVRGLPREPRTTATIRARLDARLSETAAMAIEPARRSYVERSEGEAPPDLDAVGHLRELALGGTGDGFPALSRTPFSDAEAEGMAAHAEEVVARLDATMRAVPTELRAHVTRLEEERRRTLAALRVLQAQGDDTRISFVPFGEALPPVEFYIREHPDMTITEVIAEIGADYDRHIAAATALAERHPAHFEGLAALDGDISEAYRIGAELALMGDEDSEAFDRTYDRGLATWARGGGAPDPELTLRTTERPMVGLAEVDANVVNLAGEADTGIARVRNRVSEIANSRTSDGDIANLMLIFGGTRAQWEARREDLLDYLGPVGSVWRTVDSPGFARAVAETIIIELATAGLGSGLAVAAEGAGTLGRMARVAELFTPSAALGRFSRMVGESFAEVAQVQRALGIAARELGMAEEAAAMFAQAARTARLGHVVGGMSHMAAVIAIQHTSLAAAGAAFGEGSHWTRVVEALGQGLFISSSDAVAGSGDLVERLLMNLSTTAGQQMLTPIIDFLGTTLAMRDGVVSEDERAAIDNANFVITQTLGALVPTLIGASRHTAPEATTHREMILQRVMANEPPLRLDEDLSARIAHLNESLRDSGMTPDERYVAAVGAVHSAYHAILSTAPPHMVGDAAVRERLVLLEQLQVRAAERTGRAAADRTTAGRTADATRSATSADASLAAPVGSTRTVERRVVLDNILSASPAELTARAQEHFATLSDPAHIERFIELAAQGRIADVVTAMDAVRDAQRLAPTRIDAEILTAVFDALTPARTGEGIDAGTLLPAENLASALRALASSNEADAALFRQHFLSTPVGRERGLLLGMLLVRDTIRSLPADNAAILGSPHGLALPDGSIVPVYIMSGDTMVDSSLHIDADAVVDVVWNLPDGSEERRQVRMADLCDLSWSRSERVTAEADTARDHGLRDGFVRLPGEDTAMPLVFNRETGRYEADVSRRFQIEMFGLSTLDEAASTPRFDERVAAMSEHDRQSVNRLLADASPELRLLLVRDIATHGSAESARSIVRMIEVAFSGRTPRPDEILALATSEGLRQYLGDSCALTTGQYGLAMASPHDALAMAARGADALSAEQRAGLEAGGGRRIARGAPAERVVGTRGRVREGSARHGADVETGHAGLYPDAIEAELNRTLARVLEDDGVSLALAALPTGAGRAARARSEGLLYQVLAEGIPAEGVPIAVAWEGEGGGGHAVLCVGMRVVDETGRTIDPTSAPHAAERTTYLIRDPWTGQLIERSGIDLIEGMVTGDTPEHLFGPATLSQVGVRMATTDGGVSASSLESHLRSEWMGSFDHTSLSAPTGITLGSESLTLTVSAVRTRRGEVVFDCVDQTGALRSWSRAELSEATFADMDSPLATLVRSIPASFTEGVMIRVMDPSGVERTVLINQVAVGPNGLVYRGIDQLRTDSMVFDAATLASANGPLVGVAARRRPPEVAAPDIDAEPTLIRTVPGLADAATASRTPADDFAGVFARTGEERFAEALQADDRLALEMLRDEVLHDTALSLAARQQRLDALDERMSVVAPHADDLALSGFEERLLEVDAATLSPDRIASLEADLQHFETRGVSALRLHALRTIVEALQAEASAWSPPPGTGNELFNRLEQAWAGAPGGLARDRARAITARFEATQLLARLPQEMVAELGAHRRAELEVALTELCDLRRTTRHFGPAVFRAEVQTLVERLTARGIRTELTAALQAALRTSAREWVSAPDPRLNAALTVVGRAPAPSDPVAARSWMERVADHLTHAGLDLRSALVEAATQLQRHWSTGARVTSAELTRRTAEVEQLLNGLVASMSAELRTFTSRDLERSVEELVAAVPETIDQLTQDLEAFITQSTDALVATGREWFAACDEVVRAVERRVGAWTAHYTLPQLQAAVARARSRTESTGATRLLERLEASPRFRTAEARAELQAWRELRAQVTSADPIRARNAWTLLREIGISLSSVTNEAVPLDLTALRASRQALSVLVHLGHSEPHALITRLREAFMLPESDPRSAVLRLLDTTATSPAQMRAFEFWLGEALTLATQPADASLPASIARVSALRDTLLHSTEAMAAQFALALSNHSTNPRLRRLMQAGASPEAALVVAELTNTLASVSGPAVSRVLTAEGFDMNDPAARFASRMGELSEPYHEAVFRIEALALNAASSGRAIDIPALLRDGFANTPFAASVEALITQVTQRGERMGTFAEVVRVTAARPYFAEVLNLRELHPNLLAALAVSLRDAPEGAYRAHDLSAARSVYESLTTEQRAQMLTMLRGIADPTARALALRQLTRDCLAFQVDSTGSSTRSSTFADALARAQAVAARAVDPSTASAVLAELAAVPLSTDRVSSARGVPTTRLQSDLETRLTDALNTPNTDSVRTLDEVARNAAFRFAYDQLTALRGLFLQDPNAVQTLAASLNTTLRAAATARGLAIPDGWIDQTTTEMVTHVCDVVLARRERMTAGTGPLDGGIDLMIPQSVDRTAIAPQLARLQALLNRVVHLARAAGRPSPLASDSVALMFAPAGSRSTTDYTTESTDALGLAGVLRTTDRAVTHFLLSNGVEYVTLHEGAHLIDWLGGLSLESGESLYGWCDRHLATLDPRRWPSTYGGSDPAEYLAESVSEYLGLRTEPDGASMRERDPQMFRHLERLLGPELASPVLVVPTTDVTVVRGPREAGDLTMAAGAPRDPSALVDEASRALEPPSFITAHATAGAALARRWLSEVRDGLIALGMSAREAMAAATQRLARWWSTAAGSPSAATLRAGELANEISFAEAESARVLVATHGGELSPTAAEALTSEITNYLLNDRTLILRPGSDYLAAGTALRTRLISAMTAHGVDATAARIIARLVQVDLTTDALRLFRSMPGGLRIGDYGPLQPVLAALGRITTDESLIRQTLAELFLDIDERIALAAEAGRTLAPRTAMLAELTERAEQLGLWVRGDAASRPRVLHGFDSEDFRRALQHGAFFDAGLESLPHGRDTHLVQMVLLTPHINELLAGRTTAPRNARELFQWIGARPERMEIWQELMDGTSSSMRGAERFGAVLTSLIGYEETRATVEAGRDTRAARAARERTAPRTEVAPLGAAASPISEPITIASVSDATLPRWFGRVFATKGSGRRYRLLSRDGEAQLVPLEWREGERRAPIPADADTLRDMGLRLVSDEPLLSPRDFRVNYVVDTLTSYGVSEARAHEILASAGTSVIDPNTGFHSATDFDMVMRRAVSMARAGTHAISEIRLSLENLAGLNGAFNEADVDNLVMRGIADMIRARFAGIGLQVEMFRDGGTFDVVVIGTAPRAAADNAAITAALADLQVMMSRFAETQELPRSDGSGSMRLSAVTHPSRPMVGISLHSTRVDMDASTTVESLFSTLNPARRADSARVSEHPAIMFESARLVRRDAASEVASDWPRRLVGPGEPPLSDTYARFSRWLSELGDAVPADVSRLLFVRSGGSSVDRVTRAERATARRPALDRAFSRVSAGEHAVYSAIDLRNLGGLTTILGRADANIVYADIISAVEARLAELHVDGTIIRYGGDELCIVTAGATLDRAQVDAALQLAAEDITAYVARTEIVTEDGRRFTLADIGHGKHLADPDYNGAGIVFGSVDISTHGGDRSSDIDATIAAGSALISERKALIASERRTRAVALEGELAWPTDISAADRAALSGALSRCGLRELGLTTFARLSDAQRTALVRSLLAEPTSVRMREQLEAS